MIIRAVGALALVSVLAVSAAGQSNVTLSPDFRIFAMTAALNAAGFDVDNGQYHPIRADVRKFSLAISPGLAARMKRFYEINKGKDTDESQLPKYVALAFALTDPVEAKIAAREQELSDGAKSVIGFADLLREFSRETRIVERWLELRPRYERELETISPGIRGTIQRTQGYLLLPPSGALSAGHLWLTMEMAAPRNSVTFHTTSDNYYVVLGPASPPQTEEIRHAYLHYVLDSIVQRELFKIEGAGTLLTMAAKEEGVQKQYLNDLPLTIIESLIRAVEFRMDRTANSEARTGVDGAYRTGLMFAPYFYETLELFERQPEGIRDYFPKMAAAFKVADETRRFQLKFRTIAVPPARTTRAEVPPAPPVRPPNPVADLLKEAETALNAKRNDAARATFAKVLAIEKENGPALYGMGLLESREQNGETALGYFERALTSSSLEPSIRVWAHLYAGRILDLDCKRGAAVEHYREAIRTGDNTQNAQAAARQGVDRPFGDECK